MFHFSLFYLSSQYILYIFPISVYIFIIIYFTYIITYVFLFWETTDFIVNENQFSQLDVSHEDSSNTWFTVVRDYKCGFVSLSFST